MLERRCPNCNHLFFKVQNPMSWSKTLEIQVKCPKCKELHTIMHHRNDSYDYPEILIDGIPLDELLKKANAKAFNPKTITKEMILEHFEKLNK